MRQIVLDTETTGLEPQAGHRIIEIGCVELSNRRLTGRDYHQYLRPDREIDEGAVQVHGITTDFLADKPPFEDVARDFVDYIRGAELVIHNAPFDVGFIDAELARLGPQWGRVEDHCRVTDSLALARRMHPGQRNSLDALCKRYDVDNSNRELHGALLDARILAEVYLAMTGGQVSLVLGSEGSSSRSGAEEIRRVAGGRPPLAVLRASGPELEQHEARLAELDQATGGPCLWRRLDQS
ncbi:MAG: DNA polymerase III subunit epsilon [Chromatiales bacterium]|jgi:DNA polymerase-3 subunit epsilon